MSWAVEDIPDEDGLFYRIHFNWTKDGKPKSNAFRNNPDDTPSAGMSVNWEKYSTAEEAREGARQPPDVYSVVKLIAGRVREFPNQLVVHDPIEGNDLIRANRAHTQVFGDKKALVDGVEVRAKLMEMYHLVLTFDPKHKPK